MVYDSGTSNGCDLQSKLDAGAKMHKWLDYVILYSYNTGTRGMTEIYARLPRRGMTAHEGECVYFSHISSKRVITVMFHTLEVESIVSIIVKL